MTDSRFEQLVNLYLDKEITPEGVADLKKELASSAARRRAFKQCRSLRAAENRIICGSYVRDPDDDIMPEPSRRQKLFAYVTQIGGMAAAVALSVGAFVYVARSDSRDLDPITADASQLRGQVDTRQVIVLVDAVPSRELMARLVDLKNTHAVVATRIGDRIQGWVVTPINYAPPKDDPLRLLTLSQPMSIEDLATRVRCLREMRELPGTTATVSLQDDRPMVDYPLMASSEAGY
ncbi:hypothetical protein [Ruficoccus sp. ZRK36]|uniref:hypothetical protein n=1 Tax=Ruficoccus sp. ZRK36 TaxID=2866311 RepID=UPI001C72B6AB|nr:hypothetical protein [Ruficoccus sp. ZRK36]QYY34869.1 hypothetical protein K0V07_11210 [Ruficoccus sp. ZRK36]